MDSCVIDVSPVCFPLAKTHPLPKAPPTPTPPFPIVGKTAYPYEFLKKLALCPAFLNRLAASAHESAAKATTGKANSATAEIPNTRFNIAFSLLSAYAQEPNNHNTTASGALELNHCTQFGGRLHSARGGHAFPRLPPLLVLLHQQFISRVVLVNI